jgi:hypothetical protein
LSPEWGFFLSLPPFYFFRSTRPAQRNNSKDNCQTKLLHPQDLWPPLERYFSFCELQGALCAASGKFLEFISILKFDGKGQQQWRQSPKS